MCQVRAGAYQGYVSGYGWGLSGLCVRLGLGLIRVMCQVRAGAYQGYVSGYV